MITVITAIYKSDNYLEAYARRLQKFAETLKQAKREFEVIIVPQLPSTKEQAILKSLAASPWLRIQENSKPSLYAAWNTGLRLARGEAICFWNADDVRTPAAVIAGAKLIGEGAEFVYFPFIIRWYLKLFGVSLLVKWKYIDCLNLTQEDFKRSMPFASFWMGSKSLFEKVGPFDEQFKIVSDFDYSVRAGKATDKFVRSEVLAGYFRVDGNGLSSGGKPLHTAENNIVCRRHGINDKIVPGFDELESKYQVDKIKLNGEYVEYNF